MARKKILLGEDDTSVRSALSEYLRSLNYDVTWATTCESIKSAFRSSYPDAAILDYSLPDGTAFDVLPYLRQAYPGVPLILLTGNATIERAVQAIKEGAEQFLTKPVQMAALADVLEHILQNQRTRQLPAGAKPSEEPQSIDPFIGESPAIRELRQQAEKLRESQCPILITGETGAGKGVLARWLHDQGSRSLEAFVDLNCAGLGRELLETELFGHEVGAFTGAVRRKIGLFEVGHHGTVFLDEIGDMDQHVQPKLLKILEDKRFRRLGDIQERQLDIRLISASHQDLAQMVRQKRFRSDLYFRLTTVVLTVPPLRDRPQDIPVLAQHFVREVGSNLGKPSVTLSDRAMEAMLSYSWPGNIRELRHVIERAVLLASGESISPRDLHLEFSEKAGDDPGNGPSITLKEAQRQHIQRALLAEGGNMARAAVRLGMTRSSLYYKTKALGIQISR